jgi:DNA repair protein RecO (recombination protein O)
MASEKTDGLILRIIEWSETSLIVTLLTREFGKTSAVAKGARRPKSSFEGALDLLTVCRVEIIQKSGESLDLLTEAKLERRFRAGSRDLARLYAGYYVAELLRELTDENDPHPELYDLAILTLQQLDGDTDVRACLLRFELQTLRILGHAPMLRACAACGLEFSAELLDAPILGFGVPAGGLLCENCRPLNSQVVFLKLEARNWMIAAVDESNCDGIAPELTQRVASELRGLMNRYLSYLCGGPLRLTAYLTTAS